MSDEENVTEEALLDMFEDLAINGDEALRSVLTSAHQQAADVAAQVMVSSFILGVRYAGGGEAEVAEAMRYLGVERDDEDDGEDDGPQLEVVTSD